jgi:acetyl esterase/lipase
LAKEEKDMGYTKTVKANDGMKGISEVFSDIVFSKAGGEEQKMQIISPWWDREGTTPSYPAVLFVQGCGWTFPNTGMLLPQLCELSKQGYVVATITHRNALEGHPFPACLQDVKTALRFLRAHSEEFAIDSERIGIWGTSSGGNLSLLLMMTEGDERYETDEWQGYSEKINYCAACFPPANLVESEMDPEFDENLKETFTALAGKGGQEHKLEVLAEMSPYCVADQWLKKTKKEEFPPVFLAHGNKDLLIPYKQSKDLYEKLEKNGVDVSFVTVDEAPHEGSFWGSEILELIFEFIHKNS